MQKFIWIAVLLACFSLQATAQVFYKSIDFKIATPYLEPDGRDLSLKINEKEFVSLAKVKGGIFGESLYQFEKYNRELEVQFSVSIKVPFEEEFFKMLHVGDRIRLFTNVHATKTFTAQCKVYDYSLVDGSLLNEKVLHEFKVNSWTQDIGKAMVEESFASVINSSQPRDFVTPLEYSYHIQLSPNGRKFIVYIYDYSQKSLIAQASIYDDELNLLHKGILPVDNNFINYGFYINNRAEVFILNADKVGRIALIRYNMETRDNIFLDIASSASKRYNLKLRFLNDDEVYIMNLASRSNKLTGFMYSKFNFRDKSIDKINHHELSEGLRQTAKILRSNNKGYSNEDDWMNYNITDVYLNEYEKIIVVLEKQLIESATFHYQSNTVNNVANWYEKAGKVNTGPLILYSFNSEDMLLWENYHLKNQSNDLTAGMLSSSYAMTVTADGKILMAYASSSNATGQYNEINYLLFEEASGSKVKNIKLDNKEGLSILKDYAIWFDNAVVLGARKGVFGKKSNLVRYNYSVD